MDISVVPRASRTRLVGEWNGRLKIQLNAPPVDGEANKALVALLSKTFRLRKGAVMIVAGETNRKKRVRLAGLELDQAKETMSQLLQTQDDLAKS